MFLLMNYLLYNNNKDIQVSTGYIFMLFFYIAFSIEPKNSQQHLLILKSLQ